MHSRGSYLHTRLSPGVILALVFAACGGSGDDATGPEDPGGDGSDQSVASIEVRPDTAVASSIEGTVGFEAEAQDADGNTVSAVSFSWSSSDGAVAAVDAQGTATARANGAADIEATTGGVSGAGYLSVRAGSLVWDRVRAGPFNSCGVTTHGTIECWGSNRHGQLGSTGGARSEPVRTESGIFFTEVASSGQTCALGWDGQAYCWGSSAAGERGDGTTGDSPVHSAVSTSSPFEQLTTGGNHTCGVTVDGDVLCWGRNHAGQIGDGTTTDRTTPVSVTGGLTFTQVSASRAPIGNHTCAVATDGAAYCWGPNGDGELGDGTTTDRSSPVRVAGELEFRQVSAGGRHTCGVSSSGSAYCWGRNGSGQLGDGTTTPRAEPVAVAGSRTFSRVSAGDNHTCGLTTGGTALCWGDNSTGQLGDGGGGSRSTPGEVKGGHTFRHIHAGNDHTCAVSVDGDAFCWGSNSDGQLGIGTTTQSVGEPTSVPDPG